MLQKGDLLDGKYRILSEIGHGGMSVVYMALNEKANKTWAVKEVRKNGTMDFNTVRQGLVAEIETLKRLNHPNLPSIVDVIEDDDSFIVVMDYIEGRSLDKVLEEQGAQPMETVVEWAKQLCDVFAYLHTRTPPIIYRDMKPANIMLKPDGQVMVIDFGTAKNYDIDLGQTTGLGTMGYAAPEQYQNSGMRRTDARTDIYCLGMTIFHLLTSISPEVYLINEKVIRSMELALPRGLIDIIVKCIQPLPEDRYQSCAELLYDLNHYTELEPIYRKRQMRKLAAFGVTAMLAVLLAAGGTGVRYFASQQAEAAYQELLYEAERTADYDQKIELYAQCFEIPDMAGRQEAYLALIQAYKDNDSVFSLTEANQLTKYIKNNKTELQKDAESYAEICFEVGKLYWYYYDYGDGTTNQITNAISAVEWFQDVINYGGDSNANLGMATAYANIGNFYRNITTNVTEASDKGTYAPFFEELTVLLDSVAADEDEYEIVRLELLELMRSALQQYATKFKGDGLTEEELLSAWEKVSTLTESIETTTDITETKKAGILDLLEDTYSTIVTAYSTKGG